MRIKQRIYNRIRWWKNWNKKKSKLIRWITNSENEDNNEINYNNSNDKSKESKNPLSPFLKIFWNEVAKYDKDGDKTKNKIREQFSKLAYTGKFSSDSKKGKYISFTWQLIKFIMNTTNVKNEMNDKVVKSIDGQMEKLLEKFVKWKYYEDYLKKITV